jgi:hypothetical protein
VSIVSLVSVVSFICCSLVVFFIVFSLFLTGAFLCFFLGSIRFVSTYYYVIGCLDYEKTASIYYYYSMDGGGCS